MSGSREDAEAGSYKKVLGENTVVLLGIESISEIKILNPWYQGGSETYVTDFLISSQGKDPQHLIAKACIKMGARQAMAEWFRRRERLSEMGVSFPAVKAVDEQGATWVEEFIPLTYAEAYGSGDDEHHRNMKQHFIETYLRIEGAGFMPKGLHDLRSRGDDVVMIDVGEDLGGWQDNDHCDLKAYDRAEGFFRAQIPKG